MLQPELSAQRQRRLLDVIHRRNLDAVVVGHRRHVYYLSAFWPFWLHESALVLTADGRSVLISAAVPEVAAADDLITFEANFVSTLRQEQPWVVANKAIAALKTRGVKRLGLDASEVSSQLAMTFDGECTSIEPDLWQLRRRKDPDELALMKVGIRCCEAMYGRARELIEPGVPELTVFADLHQVAVQTAGEPLTALLGNDYACGEKGGPARGGRLARDGELYILDLGPAYRGYFSDNARTFAVNRRPTDQQHRPWEAIANALKLVEKLARPGVRCVDLFNAVHEHFRETLDTGMTHHLGHGVGLQPHEYPHLNPKWDDVLIEGEIFTAEPGQYSTVLAGGIRLENQYLVTANGVENLVNFPLDLV